MTFLRQWRALAPLAGFAALISIPGLAIHWGALSFEYRLHALLAVSALCIALCFYSGFSFAELGLSRPILMSHWIGCGAVTIGLAAIMVIEAQIFSFTRQPPNWLSFAPFYILVSSPCQEVVCRAIPKLMTDKLQTSNWTYVLYSSAMFSLIHLAYGDAMLLLNTFLVGVIWGFAYLKMRNIWPLILSHAAVGTLAFSLGIA
ncbi:CPBP family intramembrane glutamic endopeptidase [Rhodopseudomonas palustris]|uniref:Abortive infection protein n=1 Tax=Rhodopseudomonas palustris (strain BisB18) TaxID=316056 RepID=Q215M2_RHOPB